MYKPNRLPKLIIKGPLGEVTGETLPTPLYENDELKLELIVEDPDQDPVNLYAENLPSELFSPFQPKTTKMLDSNGNLQVN